VHAEGCDCEQVGDDDGEVEWVDTHCVVFRSAFFARRKSASRIVAGRM
jgi:hypothetical protein